MSLEKISEKILKDAYDYSENLKQEAYKESEKIKVDWGKRASQIVKKIHNQTFVEADEIRKRKLSVANLEIRKMNLSVKQDAVNMALNKAVEKIANMDRERYLEFLVSNVRKTQFNSGEIVLNAKDKEELGGALLKALNKKDSDAEFVLSDKNHSDVGGFIISMGQLEINSTISTMVRGIKETVTPEIVSILF
jgi:V/A-type H+-transporting ATPase subunit E